MTIRLIPRLDIKGPNLVKGIHLEGLRVLGRPEEFARHYYESGADELIYMDVVASLYGRNSLHEIITRTAREIFIPLTVGGGLRTIDDIKQVLRAGADKVALNTAALRHPDIIREASRIFGASTIVVAIEAIKQPDGRYLAFTDNGRQETGVEVIGWARRVEELGAGEILITSVDREGTGLGYDLELTRAVAAAVSVPVIAHGGPGRMEHLRQAIAGAQLGGLVLSSLLHYDFLKRGRSDAAAVGTVEGNVDFLKSGRLDSRMEPAGLLQIKQFLASQGIPCRLPPGSEEAGGV